MMKKYIFETPWPSSIRSVKQLSVFRSDIMQYEVKIVHGPSLSKMLNPSLIKTVKLHYQK